MPCGAWVGCHKDTGAALGRLANAELRQAKMLAHDAFDPLWEAKVGRTGKTRKHCRGAGYKWLAERMGIPKAECHIGMFDVAQCRMVVQICRPYVARLAQGSTT